MFSLLKKKPKVTTIEIPHVNCQLKKEDKYTKQWLSNEYPSILSVNFFDKEPDIPSMVNLQLTRDFYRRSLALSGGGILEIELDKLKGLSCIRTIFKVPQTPKGITYIGAYTIPFKSYSYVLKIQAMEMDPTGSREAIVSHEMMKKSSLDEMTKNWSFYPYDSKIKTGNLMNVSEKRIHDIKFPNHPLTLVRNTLLKWKKEVNLDEKLLFKLKSFEK